MVSRAPQSENELDDPEIIRVSPEEGRRMFDEVAREWTGLSGEEFIQKWEKGEYADMPDDEEHRYIVDLVLMIPLARQDS